jgi:hypothetical protein
MRFVSAQLLAYLEDGLLAAARRPCQRVSRASRQRRQGRC